MSSEYGELVNLDNLHFAQVLADTEDSYLAGANEYLAPAAEMKKEAKVDATPRYYDGLPMFVTPVEASTDITLTVSGVPTKKAAKLTGKPYDATRGIMIDTGDPSNAPYYAMSARAELGDGGYRFYQFLKGRFSLGAETAKTKEEKITANTVDLAYTGMVTIHKFTIPDGSKKGAKGVQADTTDTAFAGADAWFAQVQTPETMGAPSALSVTSSPANNATNVLASIKPTLTFNNAISDYSGIMLFNDSDNVQVTAPVTVDSTGKIITVAPGTALTSSKKYDLFLVGIVDVYGQRFANTIVSFTVA